MVLRLIFFHLPLWRILIFCQLLSAFSWNSVIGEHNCKNIFDHVSMQNFLPCHDPIKLISGECDGGRSEFVTVRENSMMGTFITNLSFSAVPSANRINLKLSGKNADWFYLEGKTLRLNSSSNRILDREVHDSVLTATVKCYEHETLQAEHRIVVEVLNENDNRPKFLQGSIQSLELSELTPVNSVVFTIQATDADGDTLTYIIDETSPDADYFRVDLPNSGRVILKKSLDYESKTQLQLTLYAVESNTAEHYNTTATLIISVTDGDDQYPQFQPCILLSTNHSNRICANPLYTANITEDEQDIILDFFPGPIQAVDGDKGIRTTLTYTILSGADNGRFIIDSNSGDVRLTRRVENRLLTPTLRLRVMAAQVDDPLKYTVATVLVRVLAENRYPPQFNRSAYRGFVRESTSPASLVITYGSALLTLHAVDQDFFDGFNPRLQYSLNSDNNISRLFYITQEGLLIARSNQLQPNHKYFLEVVATDLESGDTVYASLHVEVLQKDKTVPHSPLGAGPPDDTETVGRTEGLAGVCLILLGITLFMLVRCIRIRKKRRDTAIRASVADNKHPNVSLRWFQLVNHRKPMPLLEDSFYHNEAFSGYDCSTSPFYGKQGIYTKTEEPPASIVDLSSITFNMDSEGPALRPNGRPADRSRSKTVSFGVCVVVGECDTGVMDNKLYENTESTASLETEKEINNDFKKGDDECINADLDIAEDENVTGFNTELQRITNSDNLESDTLNTQLKSAIVTTDPMEVEDDKVNAIHVCTNQETNQHITNLISEEEHAEASHHDRQMDDTATQILTFEDATQAESQFSKQEPDTFNPTALASDAISKCDLLTDPSNSVYETSIEKIEAVGIQDERIQITVQDTDTPNQNIVAQEGVIHIHQLSTINLDLTRHDESKQNLTANTITNQTISTTYYVNEDIKTNLDNINPEEKQESFSNIDASKQELNYSVASKLDTNMQESKDHDIYSTDTQM